MTSSFRRQLRVFSGRARRLLGAAIDERSRRIELLRLSGRVRRLLGTPRDPGAHRVYQALLEDNREAPEVYRAGRFWSDINRDFSNLIWAGALRNLRNEYFNRRFSGPEPASWQVYSALLKLYRERLRPRDRDGFLDAVEDPAEGGTADQAEVGGRRVSLDFLQSVDEAFTIRDCLREAGRPDPEVIVELGGGYGRLAFVCRRLFPRTSYVLVDLPEALTCAWSWLGRVLPGDVVDLAAARAQGTLGRAEIGTGKVWLLGTRQIERLQPRTADVFVNVFSFAEMPLAAIQNYFAQIDRILDGVLYLKQRKIEANPSDGNEISLGSYPFRPHWRELFTRDSTLYEGFFETARLCVAAEAAGC